jgi:uroporphyrinogen-III synthase
LLTGKCILLTRPAGQNEALAAALQAHGAEAWLLPLIEILPPAEADAAALQAMAAQLPDFDLAFFVSPNAVEHALRLLPRPLWPASLRVATVGPGTARALHEAGFAEVIVPSNGFDSEAVLALPEFSAPAVAGRRVLILRGNGGRELLAESLFARGVQLAVRTCYQRRAPVLDVAPLLQAAHTGRLQAMVFSSSEAVDNLAQQLAAHTPALLRSAPVFVPHARIAQRLRELGAGELIETMPRGCRPAGGLAGPSRRVNCSSIG